MGDEDSIRGRSDTGALEAAGRGFNGATGARGVTPDVGAGRGSAILAVASWGLDFRSRISKRRRCWMLAGIPSVAKVSSVLTSCAPERGRIL